MMTKSESTWGIRYLLFQLVFLPSLVRLAADYIWPDAPVLYLNLIIWIINLCAICGIFYRFLLNALNHFKENTKTILLTALIGFLLYLGINSRWNGLLMLLFPRFYNVNDATIAVIAQQGRLLMFIGSAILVPIVEEVLYRGVVFGLLRRRGRIFGYTLSIALFCAIHVMSYIGYYQPLHLLFCFLQYIPAGLVLAYVYERSGNIFTPILIHMATNAVANLLMR